MPRKPAWLAYAEKVKARMEKLAGRKGSVAQRETIILQSLFIARTRHGYPGYLGDWENVLNHANSNGRNGYFSQRGRKPVRNQSAVRQR